MPVRRLVRPLIPDRVMARYRLRQHSRQVRTNVDVVIDDRRRARRWLSTAPDTYRALPPEPEAEVAATDVVIGADEHERLATSLLAMPAAEVGVVARVGELRLVGRRRSEPALEPLTIATSAPVLDEVGGVPLGDRTLQGLLARLRDAGRRITLGAIPGTPAPGPRSDPITAPSAVVLAAVPMYDIGGGSRSAQITLQLLERGFHVSYVSMYGSEETVDLGIRHIHPNLEQYRLDQFESSNLLERSEAPSLAIAEVPAAPLFPLAETLATSGWRLVYDRIDDWSDPELGWEWYDAAVERRFVAAAVATVASAPDLVSGLEAMGSPAALVPNAVNASLFAGQAGAAPSDLPPGDGPLFGYHGSLYGDWFDWEAVNRIAREWPEARIVLIGDPKGVGGRNLPGNVSLLGLKPHAALPAYLRALDVGLLPFVVTGMTHAVSPLKVYEYLGSGVPVAAPPLRSLEGLEGVHVAPDLVEAVSAAMQASPPEPGAALAAHSWKARVATLLGHLGIEPPSQGTVPALVVERPVVHYDKASRDLVSAHGNLG